MLDVAWLIFFQKYCYQIDSREVYFYLGVMFV